MRDKRINYEKICIQDKDRPGGSQIYKPSEL